MKQDFVTFLSPGTFVAEQATRPIDSWNVAQAVLMSRDIKERYGATPYAFRFSTRDRGEDELDSRETNRSGNYYLGGQVLTLEEIKRRGDPADRILIANMESNGWSRVWQSTQGWSWTQPLGNEDMVLDMDRIFEASA